MKAQKNSKFSETLLLQGHIIDSLTFSKVLDRIMERGGRFSIDEIHVGQRKNERSRALLQVGAGTQGRLDELLKELRNLGAEVLEKEDVRLAPAPKDGVFPEGFYATTNLETWVRLKGRWVRVRTEQMDAGIRVNRARSSAETVRFGGVKRGDLFVIGHHGVKVVPLERPRDAALFEFMTSDASTEKPKTVFIRQIADAIRQTRRQSPPGKVLVVAGPAVVHTGAHKDLAWLIERGFVQVLFAGNALAAHDLEADLFGTSLGLSLTSGAVTHGGHEHHLRAINLIRRVGSIREAVKRRKVRGGIMAACVRKKIPFVLAGSIRDDGPLPEVLTDVLEAQRAMRRELEGVQVAIMLATTLHSVAVGNLLPARVRTICVDMNPSSVTKLSDRGTWQSIGLVTDVGYFLRQLREDLTR
ncbi:MAG: TIGR00300 family protein [Elusimicrobia bacterium RIFCSPLOWO2_01_FULL_59_12]|nr:MAG: TIGR00300 family protein [Elusimicrobia bacterium RIFCSPLOWO2_01_FULL_59_12]